MQRGAWGVTAPSGRLKYRTARFRNLKSSALHALRRSTLGALALAGCLVPPAARAQEAPSACAEGRISTVFVDSHSVFDLSDPGLNQRFNWAYRLANQLHIATREQVIRREILIRDGDCYDIERLRESERLLRLLPFISDVDVFGIRQPDGSIHVIVDTEDEWSTRVQVKVGSGGTLGVEGVRVREDNLIGTGQHLSAFYINDEEEQVYGVSFHTPQLLGSRWDAGLDVGRTPVGTRISESVTYPFVGEVGRWGIRQSIRHDDHFFEYWVPSEQQGLRPVWLPVRRESFDLGAAYRRGTQGPNRTLLGAALIGERISYPDEPRVANPEEWIGPLPSLSGLGSDSVSNVRVMLMTGQRSVRYVRRRALNTVHGTEDVRLGVEAEVGIGPSLGWISRDQDLALDVGLSAAGEMGSSTLAGAHLALQARRKYGAPSEGPEWNDVFAQLNAWSYWRPQAESPHTLVASVSAVGGWHTEVPFQLTLGSDAGLRGFARHAYSGGRRVVASLEQRSYLGWPFPHLLDLGGVAFADVGKIWAGDAPFGVTTPLRSNIGIGLRAAFPPGSRRTFRVDVGVPINSGLDFRNTVVLVGMGQVIGSRSTQRDPELRRSTRQAIPSALFAFPG